MDADSVSNWTYGIKQGEETIISHNRSIFFKSLGFLILLLRDHPDRLFCCVHAFLVGRVHTYYTTFFTQNLYIKYTSTADLGAHHFFHVFNKTISRYSFFFFFYAQNIFYIEEEPGILRNKWFNNPDRSLLRID